MTEYAYTYQATVLRVVDGDTLEAEVDLGFRICTRQLLRLRGIDTPELRPRTEGRTRASIAAEKAHAEEATAYVSGLLLGQKISITTYKGTSFNRWIADVVTDQGDLATLLRENGYAKRGEY